MIRFFSFLLLFCCTALHGQVDSLAITHTDSISDSSQREDLCTKLNLPQNNEADIVLLELIIEWFGTRYCYGGSSKKCTDCSGFTNNIYKDVYKKEIPRVSSDIYANCMPIRKNALYEGDLVFFATSGGNKVSHVGIYLWDGYFVHASSRKGVTISNLRTGYYMKTFVSGGAWID